MAFCKGLENKFVILFAFLFSTLIHCRSLLHLSGTQTTSDEGDTMISDMSDQVLADLDFPIDDDAVSDLQSSAVKTTCNERDKTVSDMSDQEEIYEQLADFDYPIYDDDVSDLQMSAVEPSDEGDKMLSDQEGLYEQLDDFDYPIDDVTVSNLQRSTVETTSAEREKTISDMSDKEGFYEQLDDFDYPIDDDTISDLQRSTVETTSAERDKTISDMSDKEGFYEQLDDFDYPIDDDTISDLQRSTVETTSAERDKTISDMSDKEGFYEQLDDFDYPIGDDTVSDLQSTAVIKGQLVSSSEKVWDAISTKLSCGDDFITLQLLGSGVDQVELCRGSSAPVPLGHLPPECGHASPTHGGLVFDTPYDGCGVAQEGGNYVMQMLLQGNPVVISCPMTLSVANMTTSGYQTPRFLFHSLTPGSKKPQPPGYPNMFWSYNNPYYHYHGRPTPDPTSAPTTTSAVVFEPIWKPRPLGYPNMFWSYYYPHNHYHGRTKPTYKPVPTSTTTTTPTVADALTQKTQLPAYPHLFWPYHYPKYPMQHPEPPSPTIPPITHTPRPCTTTSAKQSSVEHSKYSSVLYEKDPSALQFVDLLEHDR